LAVASALEFGDRGANRVAEFAAAKSGLVRELDLGHAETRIKLLGGPPVMELCPEQLSGRGKVCVWAILGRTNWGVVIVTVRKIETPGHQPRNVGGSQAHLNRME
jgi:hypothetical protein